MELTGSKRFQIDTHECRIRKSTRACSFQENEGSLELLGVRSCGIESRLTAVHISEFSTDNLSKRCGCGADGRWPMARVF